MFNTHTNKEIGAHSQKYEAYKETRHHEQQQ